MNGARQTRLLSIAAAGRLRRQGGRAGAGEGRLWSGGAARTGRWLLLAALPVAGAGCQHLIPGGGVGQGQPALVPLEKVGPAIELPTTRPSTRPAPSLEAVELYARARAAMQSGEVFSAITLLDQASLLDPDSYEISYALGQACAASNLPPPRAVAAFSRAAELRPDSLDAWTQLGRSQLAAHDAATAIRSLRMARLTRSYAEDADRAAVADFHLAHALEQGGYHRAAVDCYRQLLSRLEKYSSASRPSMEVQQMMLHPDIIFVPLGQLCERLGDLPSALLAYEEAIDAAPENFELEKRHVRLLLALGRQDDARQAAAAAVSRFRGSEGSIQLLRDAYAGGGGEAAVIAELERLHAAAPGDLAVAFAWSDVLASAGRKGEAEAVLLRVAAADNYDLPVVKRLYDFYWQAGRMQDAGRLMITSLASRPEFLNEYNAMMSQLLRLGRKQRLTLRQLQDMPVDSFAQSARLYWVSRVAATWARDELCRQSLERAVRTGKPFPPAYRMLLDTYWNRADWDQARKIQQSEDLARMAEREGSPALAAELRGLAAVARKDIATAAKQLQKAAELGGRQADVQTAYASVLILRGNPSEAEQTLWDVIKAAPSYEEAYATLLRFYLDRGSLNGAMRTLNAWLAADPSSPSARLFQATVLIYSRRTDLAEKTLLELFHDNSDNPDVLVAIQSLYVENNRLGEFVDLLEKDRAEHPENREVAERLIDVYAAQHRIADAQRVLDALRASAGADTDLLYYLSHLYLRLDEKQASEQVLEQVLTLDAGHVAAANDLGYYLTEAGRDLPRAEKLVRLALADEPDNQSFLDSVGWVLYKQGRFAEADPYLRRAVGQSLEADPLVLDHFGDLCYRLGRRDEAASLWQRAQQRLGEVGDSRPDLKNMGLVLQMKLRQARTGQNVQVEPIPGEPARPLSNRPAASSPTTR